MMRHLLLASVLTVSACATGSGRARADAQADRAPYSKVLVLTVGYRYEIRQQVESALVAQLGSNRTTAMASNLLLPPGQDTSHADLDRVIDGHEFDAMLTTKVVSASKSGAAALEGGIEVESTLIDTRHGNVVWRSRTNLTDVEDTKRAIDGVTQDIAAGLRRDAMVR